nr:ribonuclease H-like domain-containing protein [Tanacetum cinerariifolium]
MKTSKSISEDVSEEELKGMMQLVPLEEVYVEALQVKHPIIDWEIHSEGKREYWKIIRLGGHTAVYQFFVDMLKLLALKSQTRMSSVIKYQNPTSRSQCSICNRLNGTNGLDCKLQDDTNVLLRTPKQHNTYSIDLNNIVPHTDLTCLVAKGTADESMLWHRRLGHLNFKTMNKLVRHNLVKGLPSKCFKNDHTCVACLKGKQHKASCKK